ncbi:MAG: hypothetical protein Q9170_007811 [Blastenia crenularia]
MFELDKVAKGEEMLTLSFLSRAPIFLKLQFAIIVLFWTAIWVVKLSFLIFYRTLFTGLPEHMRGWWVVAIFAALGYFLCWAFQLASCVPIPHYFILVMALGLKLLWNLQIALKEKLALAAMFSVGLIKITIAVIRVVRIGASATHVNPIWLALWTMTEAAVAVVVACLPSFRVLFAHGRRRSELRRAINLRKMSRHHSQSNSNGMSRRLESREHPYAAQNQAITDESLHEHRYLDT